LSGAVAKLADITFWSLAFPTGLTNLGFFYWGKICYCAHHTFLLGFPTGRWSTSTPCRIKHALPLAPLVARAPVATAAMVRGSSGGADGGGRGPDDDGWSSPPSRPIHSNARSGGGRVGVFLGPHCLVPRLVGAIDCWHVDVTLSLGVAPLLSSMVGEIGAPRSTNQLRSPRSWRR
jgi:hypothetical protein